MVVPPLLHPDLDAADRFAEIAGAVVNGTSVDSAHGGKDKLKLASGELKLSIAGLACAINPLRASALASLENLQQESVDAAAVTCQILTRT